MQYYAPKTLDEALDILNANSGERNILLAGGTDVVAKINSRPEKSGWYDNYDPHAKDGNIIYLGELDMSYVKTEEGRIRIGACTTMTDILEDKTIDKIPVLKEAIENLAGLTVRNAATLGGNVMNASPAADSVPPLIAMNAEAVLAGKNGTREVPLDEFFTGPGKTVIKQGEILKEIIIPIYKGKGKFEKVGRRKAETLSVVNGAAVAEMDGNKCSSIRIAVGSVAATPLRLKKIEKMIEGKEVTEDIIEAASEAAAAEVSPIDDKRATAAYRKKVMKVVVKRIITGACL